ncbi:hypothetical protein BJF88_11310 [Cellulosimicrobium sp. CUA-896]|nr:hypothetical protein [Cellulosimicrobium sp. CUA-896]OLT53480.1 hypothetical protein BJF88_11310 [Cellulosimicrobium sp. CUA-896]
MVHGEVLEVAQLPPGSGEVRREQLLLAAEPQARGEAAGLLERLDPQDGRAGEEAAERGPG